MTKTLIFEGAGWEKAAHNGVGNCRIRTRLENKDGRIIYFEMGGHEPQFMGFVSHCFDWKDEKTNHTPSLCELEHRRFLYTKENVLKFINENLNCDFEDLQVINDGLNVHGTDKPLCSCREVLRD